jgi:glycosyltransferase involved in cell wall biosynthesis
LKKWDFIICGDIFTNNLPFKIKWKNVFYYSEYFWYEKKFVKNLIFYFIWFLFFYNKKIFVPTELAYKTFSKISKNVFYFPQIYYWEICKNKHNDKNEIKLFCVVRNIDSWMKNIGFLIDNFCYFIERDRIQLKISLTLVWEMNDKNFLDKYYKYIKKWTIKYLPRVLREELGEIYSNHDIFILPSKSDPIWAVVQEAMSNWLAILVSDRVGASSYIENWKNWCIFSLDKDGDFSTKLEQIIQNLDDYKQNSLRILEEKYRYKNEKLMEEMYSNFSNFLMK